MSELTPEEISVLNCTGELATLFVGLSKKHPADYDEFCRALHIIQYLVAKRVAQRSNPEIMRNFND